MVDNLDEYTLQEGPASPVDEYTPVSLTHQAGLQRSAVWAALAAPTDDPIGTFRQIKGELSSFGTSPTMETVEKDLVNIEERALVEDAVSLGRDDPDGAALLLAGREGIVKQMANPKNVALDNMSAIDGSQASPAAQEYATGYELLLGQSRAREGAIAAIQGVAARGSVDVLDNVADIADLAVLEQLPMRNVAQEFLGESYWFAGGDMVRDLADWIKDAPHEEWESRSLRVAESIRDNAGLITDNDVVTAFALQTLEGYLTPGMEPSDTERYITNVAGFVEGIALLPVGAVVKGGSVLLRNTLAARRLATARRVKPVDDIASASPRMAAATLQAAVDDPQVAKAVVGTDDPDEIIKMTMPQQLFDGSDEALKGAPVEFIDNLENTRHITDDINNVADNTLLFAEEVWKAKEAAVMAVIKDNDVATTAHTSAFSINRSGDTNDIKISAVYGDQTDYPLSRDKAIELATTLHDEFGAIGIAVKPKVVGRDPTTGVYSSTNVEGLEGRSFLVKVDVDYALKYSDLTADVPKSRSPVTGRVLHDPRNLVNDSLNAAISTARDRKDFVFKRALKIGEDFHKLDTKGRKVVSDLIADGDEAKEVFKYTDLKYKQQLTDAEITAYYKVRVFYDTLQTTQNKAAYRELVQEGFDKEIKILHEAGDMANAVKEVDLVGLDKRTSVVFNPYNNQVLPVEGIEGVLQQSGMRVVEVKNPIDLGDSSYTYILAMDKDMTSLRKDVIPRRTGYAYRINTDPYFVQKHSTKNVNGKEVATTSVIASSKTKAQVDLHVESLSALEDGSTYSSKIDRNIDSGKSALGEELGMKDGSGGQLWFSKRGERLHRVDGTEGAVEDPLEAMTRSANAVAGKSTIREAVQAMEIQHRAKYKHLEIDGESIWQYNPRTRRDEFNPERHSMATKELRAADNEWNYLQSLKSAPTPMDKAWRGTLQYVDDVLSRSDMTKGASGLMGTPVARAGIERPLKSAAFTLGLGLNPTRQLPLQYLSGLSLAGVSPVATMQAFAESVPLLVSMGLYDKPKMWANFKKTMKSFGYTPDEWEEVFQTFRKSGKPYSIDSDIVVSEANSTWARGMAKTRAGQVAVDAKAVVSLVPTTMKAIGFDLGEMGNQAVSWAFARRRYEQLNPGKKWNSDQRALDGISDMARDMSFDMTSTNAFSYQKGMFGAMTQFMSINHKAMLKIMYGGKGVETPAARAKYMTGIMAMYGAAGFGLDSAYEAWKGHHGVELDTDTDNLLSGGMMSLSFNYMLGKTFGEDESARTNVSSSFSPFGGVATLIPDLYTNLLENDILTVMSGPGGNFMGKIGNLVDIASATAGRTDITTIEKLRQVAFLDLPSEFGSFSALYRYNVSMSLYEKTGQLLTTQVGGGPGFEASKSELLAKALIGVQVKTEEEFFDRWLDLKTKAAGKKKSVIEADASNDAKILSRMAMREYLKSDNDLDYILTMQRITAGLHGNFYGNMVMKQLPDVFSKDKGYGDFIAKAVQSYAQTPEAEQQSLINQVMTSELMDDATKRAVIAGIKETFETKAIVNGDL